MLQKIYYYFSAIHRTTLMICLIWFAFSANYCLDHKKVYAVDTNYIEQTSTIGTKDGTDITVKFSVNMLDSKLDGIRRICLWVERTNLNVSYFDEKTSQMIWNANRRRNNYCTDWLTFRSKPGLKAAKVCWFDTMTVILVCSRVKKLFLLQDSIVKTWSSILPIFQQIN